jgi:5-deoxy-glucuronate isomerase
VEAIDKLPCALADSAEAEGPVVSCVEVERYARGFVLQHVYTDDRTLDETPAISDGQVVLGPRGHHPVGDPAGYRSYHLNVMAGPHRTWVSHNDPDHEWLLTAPLPSR